MSAARGGLAALGSVALHAVALAAGLAMVAPARVPQQALPESRLSLATMRVTRRDAPEAKAEATALDAARATGAQMAGQGVPARRATALTPEAPLQTGAAMQAARLAPAPAAPAVAPVAGDATRLGPATGTAETPIAATAPDSQPQAARPVPAQAAPAGALPVRIATARLPKTTPRAELPLAPGRVIAAAPAGPSAVPLRPDSTPAPAQAAPGIALTPAPGGPTAAALRPDSAPAAVRAAPGIPLAAAPAATGPAQVAAAPTGTHLGAARDWSGDAALDPATLETVAAFLHPGTTQGQAMRDGLAATLRATDCARIETAFDPATGRIALRGHLRDAGQRAPLLAALRAELGPGLPLDDALLILPEPQCGVLAALDRMDLPQSEEQFTNPMLVGQAAQARSYSFRGGDRLRVDLQAPDYPAYVYLDYFDGAGQVIHLVPSAPRPLRQSAPGAAFSVGRTDPVTGAPPPLQLEISAPFGQDIAVAFAASRPLYDGLRPFVEPAGPYLAFLAGAIASARAADPAFRGEWAYLFVATSERD